MFVIRRGFGCGALSFAQRSFLVLLSLFLFALCACRPRSFSSISSVIWFECHWILLVRRVDFVLNGFIYVRVRGFACPCYLPARAHPETTLNSNAKLRDVVQLTARDQQKACPDLIRGGYRFCVRSRAGVARGGVGVDTAIGGRFAESAAPDALRRRQAGTQNPRCPPGSRPRPHSPRCRSLGPCFVPDRQR